MSPRFTVLHTADWHLGVRLRDQERAGEHDLFLQWLVQLIAEREIDLLVIAGDVFDSANPPQSALLQWYGFLGSLHRECPRCHVLAVAGNHDSPHVLEAARGPLEFLQVQVVGEMRTPEDTVRIYHATDGTPALAVAAIPFLRDRDLRQGGSTDSAAELEAQLRGGIAAHYSAAAQAAAPWVQQGVPVIATGHLTASGGKLSASERDVHIGNLGAVGSDVFPTVFSAVLLGHLHRPQMVGTSEHIRYSGSPLALSFSETEDVKEVRVLVFENGELANQTAVEIPVSRPLLRVECAGTAVESTLKALAIPRSTFTPWLEITVRDSADTPALLQERVAASLPAGTAEVLSLRRENTGDAIDASPAFVPATLQELTPADVFEHTLAAASIPEEDAAALRLTFATLLDRYQSSTSG